MSIEEREQIAKTIVQQLGGKMFMLMTGVKKFFITEKGVEFMLGKNGTSCNRVQINYNYGKDLYELKFLRLRAGKLTVMKEYPEVYFDELQSLFTEFTGLYTSLRG